jgi:hypothetical protein
MVSTEQQIRKFVNRKRTQRARVFNEKWIASFENLTDFNPIAAISATLNNVASAINVSAFPANCDKDNELFSPHDAIYDKTFSGSYIAGHLGFGGLPL